jgi:hypothetical protein
MRGTPLNQSAIDGFVFTYVSTPNDYLRDLLNYSANTVQLSVENELAFLNPDCWRNLPCFQATLPPNFSALNSRQATEWMFGKTNWRAQTVPNCQCGISCGSTSQKLVMDHFYPASQGGPFWDSNLKMLDRLCNQRKASSIGTYVGDGDVGWRTQAIQHLFSMLCAANCYS